MTPEMGFFGQDSHGGYFMDTLDLGFFYFATAQFENDFKDMNLLEFSKDNVGNSGRPFFVALQDKSGLYWAIPISHQCVKYHAIEQHKIQTRGECDTILFFNVLGFERAFLIQNAFPILPSYVEKKYTNGFPAVPVQLSLGDSQKLISTFKKMFLFSRKGLYSFFTKSADMESILLNKK
jgi:hypothetical protein